MGQPKTARRPRPGDDALPDAPAVAGPRAARLGRDLRLEIFAILFALGAIHHEIEFALEAWLAGPLSEYMERWGRVVESIGWHSGVAIALHLGVVLVSLALLVVPRRELLCLLAAVFLPSQLASPHRIASHGGFMAACLSLVLILAIGEASERVARRRWSGTVNGEWTAWTLAGLRWICTLTYLFAAFYKLNPGWFSPRSAAPKFLVSLLGPAARVFGLPPAVEGLLAGLAIYGTLIIEAGLPFLLLRPSTRLLGCLVGVVFHVPMVAHGVANFPLLIIACYPAFLSLSETRWALGQLRRPTALRIAVTGLIGVAGLWAVSAMPIRWMYRPPAWRLVTVANDTLVWIDFVLLSYVAITLAASLVRRPGGRALGATNTDDETRRRAGPAGRIAAAGAAAVVLAFTYLNVGDLVGLPSAGTMFMYSGLDTDRSNHLLMRSIGLTGAAAYVSLARFYPHGVDTPEAREFGAFTQWLNGPGRPRRVSLNFVRYHLARICRSAPGARISVELQTHDGRSQSFESACDEPAMLRYWVLLAPAPCQPRCEPVLRRWARGDPL